MASSSETNSHVQHSSNHKEKMDFLEQENQLLREEITAMQTKMDEMTELMKTLAAAQSQPPPPPLIRTLAETVFTGPEWTFCANTPKYSTPQCSVPWFPPLTASEILHPIACEAQMPTH
jgi:hypothetical protein